MLQNCLVRCLHVLTGIPPITLTLRSMLQFYHLKYMQKSIAVDNHTFSAEDLEASPNIEPSWEKLKFDRRYQHKPESGYYIYTDGSKMCNKVGCAMVVMYEGVEEYNCINCLNDEASVYMAELKAIEIAIEHVLSNNINHAKIISDSRSILQALNNPNNINPPILLIKKLIANSYPRI
ncbi:hypothetical protein CDAR_604381 [Caerostris darwini]|uniref:RNase H type-1 domain-containing protein n=1 Tax=Caerostris darwini TaxID=1538125 RepID=A0AAV4MAR1_9ARAC|nr:hypothetical protein CDAR_604381 [Caerostris darwini]